MKINPTILVLIEHYQLYFNGGPSGNNNTRALIRLFNGDNVIGEIIFIDPIGTIETDYIAQNNTIVMHQPILLLSQIIDLLRTEKKLELNIDEHSSWINTL
jgi:hypothetical protein